MLERFLRGDDAAEFDYAAVDGDAGDVAGGDGGVCVERERDCDDVYFAAAGTTDEGGGGGGDVAVG